MWKKRIKITIFYPVVSFIEGRGRGAMIKAGTYKEVFKKNYQPPISKTLGSS